jgi:lysophospholipase L1-like esterase
MSPFAIIVYEIIYTILYFGLLFSKSTFLEYFPNPSIIARLFFLLILFSGFFVPYYLKLLRIRLTGKHYISFALFFSLLYILSSRYYYSGVVRPKRFHSFLQVKPSEQHAKVPKPKDVYRIICLGGSTTEEGTLKGNTYPKLLEEVLHRKYPNRKIEVINAGKYFYNTQHSLIQYLFYLKDLTPDLIIHFDASNDLITSFIMPPYSSSPFRIDYGHFYGALARIHYPMKFEEFLSRFFYYDLFRPKLKPTTFSDFKSQYSFRRNLETLIEITKCEGISLILSNQAHCLSEKNDSDLNFLGYLRDFQVDNEHYADEKSWYKGIELFNQITKETAERFSIPFVDQASAYRGRRELFTDAFHLKPEGRKLKARLFFEKIVQLKLLEKNQ